MLHNVQFCEMRTQVRPFSTNQTINNTFANPTNNLGRIKKQNIYLKNIYSTAPGSIPPFVCLYVLSSMKDTAVSSVLKVGVTSVNCLQLGCSIYRGAPCTYSVANSIVRKVAIGCPKSPQKLLNDVIA